MPFKNPEDAKKYEHRPDRVAKRRERQRRRWHQVRKYEPKKVYWGKRNSFSINRSKAKRRGLEWALSEAEYSELRANLCSYCGFSLPIYGSGLDRVDNSKGYVLGNLVPCCSSCNLTRRDTFTYEEMLVLGKVIREIKLNRKTGQETKPRSFVSTALLP